MDAAIAAVNGAIPSVGNGTVTIKQNGTSKGSFTMNQSGNTTIELTDTDTDTKYTHPTTSGNKHIPSGGSSGQILRWSADGTAAWGSDNNTTYSAASQSVAGLMSAADKQKLDGIASGAQVNAVTSVAGKTGAVTLAASDITSGALPLSRGGTGATSASAALTNLGAAPAGHTHDYIQNGTVGIKSSDSNEINFASNAEYIYFGYDNRMNSTGKVHTYKFGTHSGAATASNGNIECGSVKVGSGKMTYDSANECIDFIFG